MFPSFFVWYKHGPSFHLLSNNNAFGTIKQLKPLLYLSGRNKSGANKINESEEALCEYKGDFLSNHIICLLRICLRQGFILCIILLSAPQTFPSFFYALTFIVPICLANLIQLEIIVII